MREVYAQGAENLMISCMGVDPGVRGGLAVLAPDGKPALVTAFRPGWTQGHFVEEVKYAVAMLRVYHGHIAFMEKVGYMPSDGGKGAFTFGRVDGLIRGALLSCGLNIRDVPPMIWQARMNCLSGGDKNVTKRRAQELFSRIKVTHGIADALLIARYGWESLTL